MNLFLISSLLSLFPTAATGNPAAAPFKINHNSFMSFSTASAANSIFFMHILAVVFSGCPLTHPASLQMQLLTARVEALPSAVDQSLGRPL